MTDLKDVTILFLDETFSSTATGPMEVFRHAGTLCNGFAGQKPVSRFRVATASVDGRAVRCDGEVFQRHTGVSPSAYRQRFGL